MSPLRKINPSRANGAKSRGPKTPESLQKFSLNSLEHGLTAKTQIVDGEDPADLDALIAAVTDHFQPQNDLDLDLVLEIASLRWRLRRIPTTETGLFDRKLNINMQFTSDFPDDELHVRLARVYGEIAKSIDLLSRYESRLNRRYNMAVASLLKLRAAVGQASRPVEKTAQNERTQSQDRTPSRRPSQRQRLHPLRRLREPRSLSAEEEFIARLDTEAVPGIWSDQIAAFGWP